MKPKQQISVSDLGVIDYQEAWDYQESLLQANVRIKQEAGRQAQTGPLPTLHHLLFCEHPPVYTLGKSGHMEHLLINSQQLSEKGIAFIPTNRGGDITFHGPGQIVGYPVLDLEHFFTDIGRYLRSLEEVIIRTLAEYGITAGRSAGETGVWIDSENPAGARKICAMGIRCSRWVTMHGFALNVNTDLGYFDDIIPCGIRNKQVASMQHELGAPLPIEDVKATLRRHFGEVFGAELIV